MDDDTDKLTYCKQCGGYKGRIYLLQGYEGMICSTCKCLVPFGASAHCNACLIDKAIASGGLSEEKREEYLKEVDFENEEDKLHSSVPWAPRKREIPKGFTPPSREEKIKITESDEAVKLTKIFTTADAGTRLDAIDSLEVSDDWAVEPLINVVENVNEIEVVDYGGDWTATRFKPDRIESEVFYAAVRALAKIGRERAVTPLTNALHYNRDSFGGWFSPIVSDALVEILTTSNNEYEISSNKVVESLIWQIDAGIIFGSGVHHFDLWNENEGDDNPAVLLEKTVRRLCRMQRTIIEWRGHPHLDMADFFDNVVGKIQSLSDVSYFQGIIDIIDDFRA